MRCRKSFRFGSEWRNKSFMIRFLKRAALPPRSGKGDSFVLREGGARAMPGKSAAKQSDGSFSIDKGSKGRLDEETPFISLSYPDNPPSCLPKKEVLEVGITFSPKGKSTIKTVHFFEIRCRIYAYRPLNMTISLPICR